jgi:hypothetical protein
MTAAPKAARPATPAEPVRILYGGRYELLDLVGVAAGGAGTMYRARDVELRRSPDATAAKERLASTPHLCKKAGLQDSCRCPSPTRGS